jgi:hypothetical protein
LAGGQTANRYYFGAGNATGNYPTSGALTITNKNLISFVIDNQSGSGWANGKPFALRQNQDQQPLIPSGGLNTPSNNAAIGMGFFYLPQTSAANPFRSHTYPLTGNISEILVFNTTLSNTDRQIVEGYLSWKWGIEETLPESHPYSPNKRSLSLISPYNYSDLSLWYDASDSTTISGSGTSAFAWTDKSGVTTASRSFSVPIASASNSGGSGVYTITSSFGNVRGLIQGNSINVTGITGGSFNGTGTITNVSVVPNTSVTITTTIPVSGTATGFTGSLVTPNTFPSVSVGSVNGLNALSILDSASAITFATMPTAAPLSFFYVCSGSPGVLDATSFARLNLSFSPATPTQIGVGANGNGATVTVGSGVLTNPVLLELTSAGASSTGTVYVNGAQVGTFATGGGIFGLQPVLSRDNGAGASALYCEVIGFTRLLSTTERQQVEAYLAWKWGLQGILPTTHPYAPTISSLSRFFPSNYPGLAMWLDASDANTISFSTGSNVSVWTDKSGNGNNATQTTTALQPVLQDNGIYFGSTQFLNLLSSTAILQNVPYACGFVVANVTQAQTQNTNRGGILTILTALGGARFALSLDNINVRTPGVLARRLDGESVTAAGESTAYTYNSRFLSVGEANYSAGTLRQYLNGTQSGGTVAITVGNTSNTPSVNTPTINTNSAVQRMTNTYVYELILFRTALTISQIQQIEGYLAYKWGLQANLPITHPYYPGITSFTYITPTTYPGLALWLDAADANSVSHSGGNVSVWRDKSGNSGRDAIPSSGSGGTYPSNSINGFATIGMTPTGNMYAPVPAQTFPNQLSAFVVFMKTGTNTKDTVIHRSPLVNSDTTCSPFLSYTGTRVIGNGTTFAFINGVTNPFSNVVPTLYNFNISSNANTTWNEWINGSGFTYNLAAGTPGYNDTSTRVWLGAGTNVANPTMAGVIAEVIMYDITLTTNQRQQIEGYLAWKWGIQSSLPSTHPNILYPPG